MNRRIPNGTYGGASRTVDKLIIYRPTRFESHCIISYDRWGYLGGLLMVHCRVLDPQPRVPC